MNRPFLRHTLLCIAVTLAVFALALWIAANNNGNTDAAFGALVCTTLAGFLWAIEWIIWRTPVIEEIEK